MVLWSGRINTGHFGSTLYCVPGSQTGGLRTSDDVSLGRDLEGDDVTDDWVVSPQHSQLPSPQAHKLSET